ncbi:EAL domain-containing protein (putative c-di-GMP-specific phosphodiesterase class I) [Tamilnaduibacter salinus]|uniref:EAL domain-containing protein (Putative c-di-GMP-specific phosphodiesterase class I) n=1 Tax=Tamilnaduibacter salinus TaxID=1484056 RepID=A0A2U1CUN3_9GAMM|nr:EAL domain-containing protein [Tamilnaduibacter salinus]PVY70681.1 EAL domain-containing protein (putative c-di-GMP-specific phosphodiesterase class I) [Tamilnaduibacter salinus]
MSTRIPNQTAEPELDLLTPLLDQQDAGWQATFQGLTLRTALQPIFSISHKRIVGYEALIRAFDTDMARVLPLHLFQLPTTDPEDLMLDRLCRYLHIQNFASMNDEINWLFLNVSPRVVANKGKRDAFFGHLLERTQFPPHRVVVEIVEQPTDDAEQLRRTVEYYKELGCLTAIDDFGAGHSNFERIWNLSPDIVKLDRQILNRATDDKRARQILNGIVSLLHQSGCLVLLEGVETREQAMIAIDGGVDFVQGFFFSHPSTELSEVMASVMDFDSLLTDYKRQNANRFDPSHQITDFFEPRFREAAKQLSGGTPFQQACHALIGHHTVSRCYLINEHGVQIDDTQRDTTMEACSDPRFRPLENTRNADWYRQHYLQQALNQPDHVQVTRPYLSVTGAYMCVTLSLAFQNGNEVNVLCCDILA